MGDGSEASPLAPVIIVAALVIRTAFTEFRHPGSARRQWAFTADRRAIAAAGVVAVSVTAIGWSQSGWAAVVWALLTGVLTAHLIGAPSSRTRACMEL
ncbi:hypothetical protein E4N62_38675 [Streptomyces sp. MNU76]|uniref:hypothetical protein n=1 Tax=Streptomyces sp. MNU76 TaxID=2560026 RepID=UPI001E356E7D|nr:hypothetical protein [Streptomyces sp. MNU76]MCC9710648.1 hypothetical protein [Streptomyces sp. MNU76]